MTQESTPETTHDLPPEAPAPPPFRILGDRAKLFAALAKARAEFATLEASRTADVKGETSSGKAFSYSFDYADLPTLQKATIPGLTSNGLNIIQTYWDIKGGHVMLTMLTHDSGASLEVEVFVPEQGNVQKMAGALSYHKRYQWGGICGIAASKDDDDGNAASGNTASIEDRKPRPKPTPTPQVKPRAEPPPPPKRPQSAPPPPNGSAPQPEVNPAAEVKSEATAGELAQSSTLALLRGTMLELKFSKEAAWAFCEEFGGTKDPKTMTEPAVQELVKRCEKDGATWLQGWQP
jgi:hypothetical protein